MEDLYVDDAVDLLEELPANVVKRGVAQRTARDPCADQSVLAVPGKFGG